MQHGELPLAAKEDLEVAPTPPSPSLSSPPQLLPSSSREGRGSGPRAEDGQSLGGASGGPRSPGKTTRTLCRESSPPLSPPPAQPARQLSRARLSSTCLAPPEAVAGPSEPTAGHG
ncbi:hypothetical protein GW17_00013429 [Ensete ventricosum]|nr:hypothetical protein GW17_00013429 [Ensete ventricosum]